MIEEIDELLGRRIIQTKYFVFDLWMIVHFGSGVILGWFIKDWRKAFAILIVWEILEILIFNHIFFVAESQINILWDLIFGMTGYKITRFIKNKKEEKNDKSYKTTI